MIISFKFNFTFYFSTLHHRNISDTITCHTCVLGEGSHNQLLHVHKYTMRQRTGWFIFQYQKQQSRGQTLDWLQSHLQKCTLLLAEQLEKVLRWIICYSSAHSTMHFHSKAVFELYSRSSSENTVTLMEHWDSHFGMPHSLLVSFRAYALCSCLHTSTGQTHPIDFMKHCATHTKEFTNELFIRLFGNSVMYFLSTAALCQSVGNWWVHLKWNSMLSAATSCRLTCLAGQATLLPLLSVVFHISVLPIPSLTPSVLLRQVAELNQKAMTPYLLCNWVAQSYGASEETFTPVKGAGLITFSPLSLSNPVKSDVRKTKWNGPSQMLCCSIVMIQYKVQISCHDHHVCSIRAHIYSLVIYINN